VKSNKKTKDTITAIEKAIEKIVSMASAVHARDGPNLDRSLCLHI
jgi:hypothetical protein